MRRWGRYLLSWGVTIGLLWWVLHRLAWHDVWAQLSQVHLAPLALACLLSIMGNAWLACEKYRLILRGMGFDLDLREVILMKLGSLPLKNVLPLKTGELTRLVYLQRNHKVSYIRGGASVLLNVGWSVLAVGMIMIPGCALALSLTLAWVSLGLLSIWVLLVLLGLGKRAERGRQWRPRPGGSTVGHALALARSIGPAGFIRLGGFSIAFEGVKVVNYALIFHAMGLLPPLDQFLRATPPLILLSSLPFSIMGLGLREGSVLMAFSSTGSEASLVSVGLWVSVVEGVVPLLAGLLLLKSFMTRLLASPANDSVDRRGEFAHESK
jgi:glycosyltransferase 2 family protein